MFFAPSAAVMAALAFLSVTSGRPVFAQTPPVPVAVPAQNGPQTVGRYTVVLRVPDGGIFAGEETDLFLHLSDSGRPDPILGPLGITRAKISGEIAASPDANALNGKSASFKPAVYESLVPGDYRIAAAFPRSGTFVLSLTIEPPAGGSELVRVAFPVTVLETPTGKNKPKPAPPAYSAEIETVPYRVGTGENAKITVGVKSRDTKKSVSSFDDLGATPLHLFLVKDDLSAFFHEVPKAESDGEFAVPFVVPFAFPSAGQWRIWADVAPKNAGELLLPGKIEVSGVRPLRVLLGPTTGGTVRSSDGSVLVSLKTSRLTAKVLQSVAFDLRDARGGDVTDLQPFGGSLAYFAAANERNGDAFVVARADETDPRNGRSGTIAFLVRFPQSGIYKIWLQFQRSGGVSTTPFVVRVGDK